MPAMSHVVEQRQQLIGRINRLIGQLNALKQGIEEARGMDMAYTAEYCAELQAQIEAAK